MPAPKLTSFPYVTRGIMNVVVLGDAPASLTAITRAEIDAGDDVSDQITAMGGFSYETSYTSYPVLGRRKEKKLPSGESLADSSLTFERDRNGAGPHTLFTSGGVAYLLMFYGGDVATYKVDLWICDVGGVNPVPSLDGSVMTTRVDLGVSDVKRDLTVPAYV